LERLPHYLANDAPVAAKRFAGKIIDRVKILRTNPLLGGLLSEDGRSVYGQIRQGNCRAIYRLERNVAYLVAVHHAARLLDTESLK
jgi:plasmid stabilization system protein ParE